MDVLWKQRNITRNIFNVLVDDVDIVVHIVYVFMQSFSSLVSLGYIRSRSILWPK